MLFLTSYRSYYTIPTLPVGSSLCYTSRNQQLRHTTCDGEINAMVEGLKFRESHVLKNTKLKGKGEEIPRPLEVFYRP
jgi:hypothetical protein